VKRVAAEAALEAEKRASDPEYDQMKKSHEAERAKIDA
jgi:hypothetical protein